MAIVTEYNWESDTLTHHPPAPPARSAFRKAVAEVAAKAKAKLPAAVNGRVESAVKLVLSGDVLFLSDGTIEVGSSTDPAKVYTLAGHACDCQNFSYGQAPEGWCQHRIAAGIAKRVQELLPQTPAVGTAPSPQPLLPAPLPEARCSANVRLQVCGRDVQFTMRDHDEAALLMRLEELLQRYPASQPQAPAQATSQPQEPEKRYCPKHGVEMQQNHKEGRSWWSHCHEGQWCKGK